jgi:hypothetical protein
MGTLKYFVSWLVWHWLLTFLTATLLLANYILTINNNKWMDGGEGAASLLLSRELTMTAAAEVSE